MKNSATAEWKGSLKDGNGTVSTASGVLKEVAYTFAKRFEGTPGLNPEELIAAAHAGCFSMALSAELGKSEIVAKNIQTESVVTLEKSEAGFAIVESALKSTVSADGADRQKIEAAAASAKENCPISKLLNARISLDLKII